MTCEETIEEESASAAYLGRASESRPCPYRAYSRKRQIHHQLLLLHLPRSLARCRFGCQNSLTDRLHRRWGKLRAQASRGACGYCRKPGEGSISAVCNNAFSLTGGKKGEFSSSMRAISSFECGVRSKHRPGAGTTVFGGGESKPMRLE
jgi:hypothetical protein